MLRLALVALAFVVATATHAHSPPIGADTAAFAVDDGCAPSPMEPINYEARGAFLALWDGDDYREPFTLGPVEEGVTTRFGTASQSVFKSGRARITIRLDDAYGWERKRIFRLMARSLASLPGALSQRVPYATTLDLTQFRDGIKSPTAAYARSVCYTDGAKWRDCSHNVVVPSAWFDLNDDGRRPVPSFIIEKTLVHEFAHVLDAEAGDWSDTEEWQAAMAESPCAVSTYATTNAREDFAESVVAWFGYYAGRQGRLEPEDRAALRERLGKRFGLLNKLMHGRFDE